MELPAHTSPTGSTQLEQLGKEQTLGKAADLGCPGFETPNAITTAVYSGPTKISVKTSTTRNSQTTAIPAAIPRSPATAVTATTPGCAAKI